MSRAGERLLSSTSNCQIFYSYFNALEAYIVPRQKYKYKRIFRFITVSFDNSIAGTSAQVTAVTVNRIAFSRTQIYTQCVAFHRLNNTQQTEIRWQIFTFTHQERLALFKQYTNIDGHISQKVFNKLLWLMALDMPLYMALTMESMCAMKCINWFLLFMASTIFDLHTKSLVLTLTLKSMFLLSRLLLDAYNAHTLIAQSVASGLLNDTLP